MGSMSFGFIRNIVLTVAHKCFVGCRGTSSRMAEIQNPGATALSTPLERCCMSSLGQVQARRLIVQKPWCYLADVPSFHLKCALFMDSEGSKPLSDP